MKVQALSLVTACLLAGGTSAYAQEDRKQGQEPPGRAEQMPAPDRGKEVKTNDKGADKSSPGSASEKASRQGSDKQADRDNRDAEKRANSAAGKNSAGSKEDKPKGAAQNQTEKPNRDSAASEDKKPSKASQAKPDEHKADQKSSAQSKPDQTGDKQAGKESSKPESSSSGTGTGEAGNADRGNVAEDRKSSNEVKKVQVPDDKRERVKSAFRGHGDVKHETNVTIKISLGTRAPRAWAFAPVPIEVVELVPEYRGYDYAYVDDQYVVCDPDTYEVVAILPLSDSAIEASAGGGRCSTELTLSEDERAQIIQSVEISNEVRVSGVTIGWSVPRDIEVHSFPEPVLERSGKLSSCRYFMAGDRIAIVDPEQDKVVLLLDQH